MTATSDRRLSVTAHTDHVEGASQPGRPRPADPTGPPAPATGRAWRHVATALVLGLTLAVGFFAGRAGDTAGGPVRAAAPDPTAHLGHGPGGLEVSRDGWTLAMDTPRLTVGKPGELVFRITDPTGAALTTFKENHERRMHLVVVGRDLAGYQHVHPQMSPDGTWRVAVTPARPARCAPSRTSGRRVRRRR